MDTVLTELTSLMPVDLDAGLVFSGKPSGRMVKGYDKPSAYTPSIDNDYVFHASSRDIVVWFLDPCEPLYVFGPTGAGKTSLVKQLAARLNYPVFEVTGHGRLEFSDLIGHLTVENGTMRFENGPLTLAMRYGGIFLLNEIDLTSPDVAAGLNGVLDGSPLCLAENGGEVVEPHPMFRFVATANSNGGGDESGMYQGVQRQNLAFADRFVLCEVTYPASNIEENLLQKRCAALPKEIIRKMVSFANDVRKQFIGESTNGNIVGCMDVTFSTRSLLRWADLTVKYQPLASQGIQPVTYALDRALAFRASCESRAMLHELAQRVFPQMTTGAANTVNQKDGRGELEGDEAINYLVRHLGNRHPLAVPVTVHLRKESDCQGHTKDWLGTATEQELTITFGRTGTSGQSISYKSEACAKGTAHELLSRANRKISEGYRIIVEESVL